MRRRTVPAPLAAAPVARAQEKYPSRPTAGSAAFGAFMKCERARRGEVVRKARITVD